MVGISSIPSITQMLQSISKPQVPDIQVGTANAEANSAAAAVVPSAGSVGSGSGGGSIDTTA